jgi:hypothetical protein
MRSVSNKTGVSKKATRDRRILAKARREEVPVSAGITKAAERAGIEPFHDTKRVTIMKGDAEYVVSEIKGAFDDVFGADAYPDGGSRDVCILRALRRLRTAQDMLGLAIGGAS